MPDQAPSTRRAKLRAGLVMAAFEFVSDCLHPELRSPRSLSSPVWPSR